MPCGWEGLISLVVSAIRRRNGNRASIWLHMPSISNAKVVFFDPLWVNIREDIVVRNKAVHLALGEGCRNGTREIPGLWIEPTEAPNSG